LETASESLVIPINMMYNNFSLFQTYFFIGFISLLIFILIDYKKIQTDFKKEIQNKLKKKIFKVLLNSYLFYIKLIIFYLSSCLIICFIVIPVYSFFNDYDNFIYAIYFYFI